jgi:hypothetical protein
MYLGSSCMFSLSSLVRSMRWTRISSLGPWGTALRPVTEYSDHEVSQLTKDMDYKHPADTHPVRGKKGRWSKGNGYPIA